MTFNARYGAPPDRIKEVLMSGEIGQITSVDFYNDIMMSYSLNACMPYEGYSASFNGTKGRFDARVYARQRWEVQGVADLSVSTLFGKSRVFSIDREDPGGHGGADPKLQDRIFRKPTTGPLKQAAGSRDGALSIMIGIAARRSIEQQRPMVIEDLVKITAMGMGGISTNLRRKSLKSSPPNPPDGGFRVSGHGIKVPLSPRCASSQRVGGFRGLFQNSSAMRLSSSCSI